MRFGNRSLALVLSTLVSSTSTTKTVSAASGAFVSHSSRRPSVISLLKTTSTKTSTTRAPAATAPFFTLRSTPSLSDRHHRHIRGTHSFLLVGTTKTAAATKSNQVSMMSTKSGSDETFSESKVIPGRVALCQFHVTESKSTNHETASNYIQRAAARGAQLVVLPEIWNGPYATSAFDDYAEIIPPVGTSLQHHDDDDENDDTPTKKLLEDAPSVKLLMENANRYNIWLVGGSVPERDGTDLYNTCLVIDPRGTIVAKHRKLHLFDIDVPNGITFFESDTLSSGGQMTAFQADEPLGMIGIGICYDIRFPEYALLLCKKHKCNILIYPGAFNLTTGPAHWELLQRARALDNQVYVLTASPARTPDPETEGKPPGKYPHYTAWGHSTAVSPWGDVVATVDEKEALVIVDLDMDKVGQTRRGIPTGKQKRYDLYDVVDGDSSS